MTPFIDLVRDSVKFQAMITAIEPLMTQPQYTKYFTPTFNETKDWKGIEKVVGRVPVASYVSEHSGKSIVKTGTIGQLSGELPTWGDLYPITSDELIDLQRIENYLKQNGMSGNSAISQMQIDQLEDQRTDMLRRKFDPIARMPTATMDMLAFEEWSNGTASISNTKNDPKSGFDIDFEVKKYHVPTVWSNRDSATALADLDAFVNRVWKDLGIRIDTLALNPDEIRKILLQKSSADIITSYTTTSKGQIKTTGRPSIDDVNITLQGQYRLPAITQIDAVVDIRGEGGDISNVSESRNAFLDGRVAATVGTQLGDYMYTLTPEQRLPDKDYTYAVSQGNVLLSALSKKGEFSVESELCALPILTGRKKMAILVTDDTTTGDPLY